MEGNEIKQQMFEELHESIKKGRIAYAVKTQLENYNIIERRRIVSCLKDGCSPLFLASQLGDCKSADYLLDVCHADIEQRGEYEAAEERSHHFVTPLWCAAVAGHFAIVRTLVLHGADINSTSDTGSTPVRSACFMTNIEIVRYLTDLGAQLWKPNYNGGTCLINSVQSVPLCKILIGHGVKVNAQDIQAKTALHYAIQEYRLETVKLLIENGANANLKNRYGDDALQTACLRGSAQIFNYLIEQVDYDRERLIEAYELLGATLLEENHNVQAALEAWRTAIKMRFDSAHVTLPKVINLVPNPVYMNAMEHRTWAEIQAISTDPDALHMQALLICERILSTHHKDMIFRLMYRGAVFADMQRYQRCVDFWQYALQLRVARDGILHVETTITAQAITRLFLEMIGIQRLGDVMETVQFSDIYNILLLISTQLEEGMRLLNVRPVFKKQMDNFNKTLLIIIYLLYTFTRVQVPADEMVQLKRLLNKMIRLNLRSAGGDSLLHVALDKKSSVFDDPNLSVFPNRDVTMLLLECGADVNALDYAKNCPLHVLANLQNYEEDLVTLLMAHGAHIDIRNADGETVYRRLVTNPECTLNLLSYMSLKCLAAQAAMHYKLPYRGQVPVSLEAFIEWH
ncbi:PREDICTED: protein fem-1 homolog A-like [Priapulus caudatus]|uniref:Protein fem-1 homolog A-like n=1 Tax=Priapulus caudatus TaxID=37621 RepID=A0ABM1F9A9_PRICU|nr:PREDICTED: protein fem-1 homolog A-like [Priapulus caudatus]